MAQEIFDGLEALALRESASCPGMPNGMAPSVGRCNAGIQKGLSNDVVHAASRQGPIRWDQREKHSALTSNRPAFANVLQKCIADRCRQRCTDRAAPLRPRKDDLAIAP